MNNVIQTVGELAPFITTGAVVGMAADLIAQHGIRGQRQELAEAWGSDVIAVEEDSRLRRLGRAAVGTFAAVGALTGAYNGHVWQPEDTPDILPPHVEVVVDYSGGVTLNDGEALVQIDNLVDIFAQGTDEGDIEAQAVVAGSGEVRTMPLAEVIEQQPFGDAPLEQATLTAMDNNARVRASALGNPSAPSVGTVVITNGNSIGVPDVIAKRANALGMPVYIVNVEDEGINPVAAEEFKAITDKTEATYWEADTTNIEEVVEKVEETLVSSSAQQGETDKGPGRVLAAVLSAGAAFGMYRIRHDRPVTFNGSKVRS